MLRRSLSMLMVLALAGCPGGSEIGDSCGGNDDCAGSLQCLNSRCVPQCARAPDCGDGYACDDHHLCQPASGHAGDRCSSEVECVAGLSCQIAGTVDADHHLLSTCTAENPGRPAGNECIDDDSCRNGTCALGHCIDLCRQTSDCGAGNRCVTIPHLVFDDTTFSGCLPSEGIVSWSIPMVSPSAEILLPVPDVALSAELVMSVDDIGQKVGVGEDGVLSPNSGDRVYHPCKPPSPSDPPCDPIAALDVYYQNAVRHRPELGQSVLMIPSGSRSGSEPGVYRVQVSSFRSNDTPGSAIPHVTAIVQLGPARSVGLDLHFFFLDLADHPCAALTDNQTLDARAAKTAGFFQDTYLGELRAVFSRGGVALNQLTFEDITDHPELDGLDVDDAGDLLTLGKFATGINVFFVRSLSPIGIQAYGPNPGPAGIGSTRQSGIVIGLDTLCYRDWSILARLTAHEIARYMGLYHNVELETAQHPLWRDLIDDDDDGDPSTNLMYFSELGGSRLSRGQSEILKRSAVLR